MLKEGNTIKSLETAVADLHTCASESLLRIHGMARCALLALETTQGVRSTECIAEVLAAIVNEVDIVSNSVDGIAGDVGVDTIDPAWRRRLQAAHEAAKEVV